MMERFKLARQAIKIKESDIEKSIRRWLDLKGIFNWPTHAGQIIPAQTGVSDIGAVLPKSGRSLYIEVKLPGWRPPSEDSKRYRHYKRQKDFIESIRKSNGVAFFATSIGEVESQLEIERPIPARMGGDHG